MWAERRSRRHRSQAADLGLSDHRARHYDGGASVVGIIAAAAAVAGTAVSTYGAISSGQAQSAAANYNAQEAAIQAQQARDAAKVDAQNQEIVANRAQATTRARAAGSGIDPSYGSPLLTVMDNARQASMEHSRILYGGEVRAAGLESGAALDRFQGSQYARAGYLGAGINLLSGIARVGSQYTRPSDASQYTRPRGVGSGLLDSAYQEK